MILGDELEGVGWSRGSDAHGHEDIAVLVLGVGVFGAHLAGGLGVSEFEADFAFVAERLEEVQDVTELKPTTMGSPE